MKSLLPLDDSEIFFICSKRYFNKIFTKLDYTRTLIGRDPNETLKYTSVELGQKVEIVYDFLRSDRPYYQVSLSIEKKGLLFNKHRTIEVLNYFNRRKEPETIEETLALIKEFLSRYFMPVLKGEKWIDEI
ncbi:MAG TPA: hypothetical protein VFM70_05835 [Salinimicrobium sp.]|nr:hypothetical protein [Salinimicrobium sp.]